MSQLVMMVMTENISEPINAAMKPLTLKPGTISATSQKSKALITKINNPSVSSVTGSVRMTSIGRMIAFTRPSTSAAIKAGTIPVTVTPE